MLLLSHRSVLIITPPSFKWDNLMCGAKSAAPIYKKHNELTVSLNIVLLASGYYDLCFPFGTGSLPVLF